jgi:hypothetical protein
MTNEVASFTTPVGRLLSGDAGTPEPITDNQGVQKLDRQTGEPLFQYRVSVAIQKTQQNWWDEPGWGPTILQAGQTAWPQGQAQSPTFSWKITDGDSQTPNRRGKRPCDMPNHPGNWILTFKTAFAPKLVNADGSQVVPADTFYRGCFIQVHSTVRGNNTPDNAGVYLNHDAIAFAAHGERINTGPDTTAVGFGGGQLPPGASAQPIGQNFAANVPTPQQPAPGQPQAAPMGQAAPDGSPHPMPAPGAVPSAQPSAPAPAAAPATAASPTEPYYGAMQPPGAPQ